MILDCSRLFHYTGLLDITPQIGDDIFGAETKYPVHYKGAIRSQASPQFSRQSVKLSQRIVVL